MRNHVQCSGPGQAPHPSAHAVSQHKYLGTEVFTPGVTCRLDASLSEPDDAPDHGFYDLERL